MTCGHPFPWKRVTLSGGVHSTKGTHPWIEVTCSAPVGAGKECGDVTRYEPSKV
jgi:hypothetical protein